MSKIIDLQSYKNKERKEIEDKAYQQYGILKLSDDLYLYPETSFTTGSLDLKVFFESKLCMNIEEILEADVIESINNINSCRITITVIVRQIKLFFIICRNVII